MIPLNLTWREIKKKLVTFEEDGDRGEEEEGCWKD
jgi:hypothetical protein